MTRVTHAMLVATLLAVPMLVAGCSKDPETTKREFLRSGDESAPEKKYSVGVVEYPGHGNTVDELLDQAEVALKSAKEAGKNRTVVAG